MNKTHFFRGIQLIGFFELKKFMISEYEVSVSFCIQFDSTKNKHLRVSPFKFTKGIIETMELFEG